MMQHHENQNDSTLLFPTDHFFLSISPGSLVKCYHKAFPADLFFFFKTNGRLRLWQNANTRYLQMRPYLEGPGSAADIAEAAEVTCY